MLKARHIIGIVVVAGAALAVGCASSGKGGKPVNSICPIGGHEIDPALTATYNGQTIAFCCDSCEESFAKMSDEKKAEVVAKAAKK